MSTWIAWLLYFGGVAAMALYTAWAVRRAMSSRHWPSVQATVLSSRVVGHGKGAEPRIEYAYIVGGCRFTSRRRAVGLRLSISGDWADKVVAACPPGSTVTVSVDPRDPAYAVLVPGFGGAHLLMVAVVGGMAIVSVIAALPFVR